MNDEPVKSYDALKAQADARWHDVQLTRTKRLSALQDEIAAAPDVKNAPPVGTLYSHPAIVCACGGLAFTVRRYGCVNGVRDKAELSCQRCGTTMIWDWPSMTWLN